MSSDLENSLSAQLLVQGDGLTLDKITVKNGVVLGTVTVSDPELIKQLPSKAIDIGRGTAAFVCDVLCKPDEEDSLDAR